MRLNVSTKLILAIPIALLLSFGCATLLTLNTVRGNNADLVRTMLTEFDKSMESSITALREAGNQTAENLQNADREIGDIVRNLYEMSNQRLVQSLGNQIYPLIENFDYKSAGSIIEEKLKSDKDISWIRFTTSETPSKKDVFEYGSKQQEEDQNIRTLSWKHADGATYLNLDMQVCLTKAQIDSMDKIRGIISAIIKNNKETLGAVKASGESSKLSTRRLADTLASKGNQTLVTYLAILMSLILVVTCTAITFFTRNNVIQPIRTLIAVLKDTSGDITSTSNMVASSSQQLAEGATEQAAALEQTSTSLEEMAAMTRRNAENASNANQLMKEATVVVERANGSMNSLTESMQEITKASEETQKIIRTIDEIAFQTNLLALNAAVEAARAGEAGAGFAVVADEVRNLAMRAADAAKNTAQLIEGTVKKVKDGWELVDRTNAEFREVATSVAKSGDLVSEITSASKEQAQGIEQVGRAVSEMERVTQQNGSTAEESASASEQMSSQAQQIEEYVSGLVVLVGTKADTNHGSDVRKGGELRGRKGDAPSLRAFVKPLKSNGRGYGREVSEAGRVSKEANPAQIIPFGDGDLSDF